MIKTITFLMIKQKFQIQVKLFRNPLSCGWRFDIFRLFARLSLFVFVTLAISGCGMIFNKVITLSLPNSKYSKIGKSIDRYYTVIKQSDGVVVKDKLGTYFHKEIDNDLFLRFVMMNEDHIALKSILSSSYGIMEPLYSYKEDHSLYLDLNENKRRYLYFTKELGLKLSPLSVTMTYHELIIKSANERVSRHKKSAGLEKEFFLSPLYGEDGLYNPLYFKKILSKIIEKETYIVSNNTANSYYLQIFGAYGRTPTKATKPFKWSMGNEKIIIDLMTPDHYSINFIPIDYFKSLHKGGSNRHYSGCSFVSKSADIRLNDFINEMNETTAIPYISGIYHLLKEKYRDQEYSKKARQRYLNEFKKYKSRQAIAEEACKVGFKEIGLSGFIESQRL